MIGFNDFLLAGFASVIGALLGVALWLFVYVSEYPLPKSTWRATVDRPPLFSERVDDR